MLLDHYDPNQYAITTRYLTNSFGPAYPLQPKLFVVHSTGTLALGLDTDTVDREFNHFNDPTHQVSATYCLDANSIAQFVPLDQISWQVGRIGNRVAWGVELCEARDPAVALEVIRRGIWLAVHMVLTYGVEVVSHHEISQLWPASDFTGGTDHTDPDDFFGLQHYTWAEFKQNVDTLVAQARVVNPPAQPVQVGGTLIPDGILLDGRTLVPLRPFTDALWQHWLSREPEPSIVWAGPGQPVVVD